jgi:hypothetical protein
VFAEYVVGFGTVSRPSKSAQGDGCPCDCLGGEASQDGPGDAKGAGYSYVALDGTFIRIDRVARTVIGLRGAGDR